MLSRTVSALRSLARIRRSRFLLAVVMLALLLRVAFVLAKGVTDNPKILHEFGLTAQNMSAGAGYSMHWWYQTGDTARHAIQQLPPAFESAYMPPLNIWIVYLAFQAFGVFSPQAALALMLFYAVVGALTPVAVYSAARGFAGEEAARLAAVALALFPPTIFAVITFSGSVLFQTGALMAITLALGLVDGANWRRSIALGLVSGVMVFLRSEFLMLGLLMIAAATLLAMRRQGRAALLPGVLSAVLMLAVVAPWTYRNHLVFDRFVPVISKPWAEIWRGNNDYAEASSFDSTGEQNWFLKPHYRPLIARLDSLPYNGRFELAADSIFRDEAQGFIRRNPARALALAARRVIMLWSVDTNHPTARNPLYIAMIVPTLLLILSGFVLTIRECRRRRAWAPAVLYGLFFGFTSIMVAITHVQPRHQIYLVTVAFPFVGIALARLLGVRPFGAEVPVFPIRSGVRRSEDPTEPTGTATA